MPIVRPTPNLTDLYGDKEKIANIISVSTSPTLQPLVQRASDDYLYWSDVKYRIPAGIRISAEEVWAYLKLVRRSNQRIAPLLDKKGRSFTYWITDWMHQELSQIDKWTGGTIATNYPGGLPSRERYIISSLMDEAIASSQLEGATTEFRVAKEMLRTGRKPSNEFEQMIFNNWKAMQFIRENAKNKLILEMLCELQAIITQDTLEHPEKAGKLREEDDDIVVKYRNEIIHEPPKAAVLKERMELLCAFANRDEEGQWIHPVIKGAMLHFWIGYDHPFCDGNGRTARAVMYWYLLNRGYWLFQYLSISKHVLRAKGQYVRAYCYTENDDNDLNYFLVFNLSAIQYAIQGLRQYLDQKTAEMANADALLQSFRGLNRRQKSLIYHAIQNPTRGYTIEAHRITHGVAYDTARRDMLDLVSKKFLRQTREGKKLLVFHPVGQLMERLKAKQEQVDQAR